MFMNTVNLHITCSKLDISVYPKPEPDVKNLGNLRLFIIIYLV